jgi:hypothetical protein
MFDLYDIYDTSEITIIILMVFLFVLVLIVFMLFLFSKGSNVSLPIELPKGIDYEKKYNDLIEKKGEVPQDQVKYSPSEFSTLLKYNPILPYSAFTWDIINNAYLDFNERSNYDDRYFSLANYDNIYQSSNNNNNSVSNLNSNTDKLSRIMENVNRYKMGDNNNNGLLDESYKEKNKY